MSKPVLSLDLDGVIHPNTSPWSNAYTLPDAPTTGAQDYVRFVQASGWRVVIQSARCNAPNADAAVQSWLYDWGFPALAVTHLKGHATVYLDDRALRFNGAWPALGELEAASVPWNRNSTR